MKHAALAVAAMALLATACTRVIEAPRGIEVEADGKAVASYQAMKMVLHANVRGRSADEVHRRAAAQLKPMIEALRGAGVTQDDVTLEDGNPYCPEDGGLCSGGVSYVVVVRDVAGVGRILGKMVAAAPGVGGWGQISLEPGDQAEARNQAAADAIAQARAGGAKVAAASDVRLGRIVWVEETGRPAPASPRFGGPTPSTPAGVAAVETFVRRWLTAKQVLLKLRVRFALR